MCYLALSRPHAHELPFTWSRLTFTNLGNIYRTLLAKYILSFTCKFQTNTCSITYSLFSNVHGAEKYINSIWPEFIKGNKKKNLKTQPNKWKVNRYIVYDNIGNSWTLRQRSKLWFNNAKWNHQAFYSIYRSRGSYVIPIGITWSERVNYHLSQYQCAPASLISWISH